MKPEAAGSAGAIAGRLEKAGFTIVKRVGVQLSDVRAEEFYKNSLSPAEMSTARTNALVQQLSAAPVVVFVAALD